MKVTNGVWVTVDNIPCFVVRKSTLKLTRLFARQQLNAGRLPRLYPENRRELQDNAENQKGEGARDSDGRDSTSSERCAR